MFACRGWLEDSTSKYNIFLCLTLMTIFNLKAYLVVKPTGRLKKSSTIDLEIFSVSVGTFFKICKKSVPETTAL